MKRFEWLAQMINDRNLIRVAELGVREGTTMKHLLNQCRGLVYYLGVDLWEPQPDNDGPEDYMGVPHFRNYRAALEIQQDWERDHHIFGARVELIKGHTLEVAKTIKDRFFDLVFVDADHGYPACKNDILAWKPKVKSEGILCGHDYHWPTVRKSVQECLVVNEVMEGENHIWWVRVD